VLHQIGIGTLGPVFRTYEPTRDRLVAVKVFRLDIIPEQAQVLADALSRATQSSLFHPSIVEPIASGVEGTVAYRAEEYVAAESLDVAMRHYAPASIEKALPFITQLAGAIDFARAAGVGHGGLHPRDIFVTPDEARATGFGVVEALEEVGIRAPIRRPYTAPERIEGAAWGTPADVFSLAAIAFELLTARRPAGTGAQAGALPEGQHSAALHAVLARALDDDPARRYGSALAFAAALEAAARGEVGATAVADVAAIATIPASVVPASVTPESTVPLSIAPAVSDELTTEDPGPGRAEALRYNEEETPGEFEVEEALDPVHEALVDVAIADAAAPTLFDEDKDEDDEDERDDDTLDLGPTVTTERFAEAFVEEEDFLPEVEEEAAAEEKAAADHALVLDHSVYAAEKPMFAAVDPEPDPPAYVEQPERSRSAILPFAVVLVPGLLGAFALGYFVRGNRQTPPAPPPAAATAQSAPSPTGVATPEKPGQYPTGPATPDRAGQYSEQKVTVPPPVPPAVEPAPVSPAPQPGSGQAPRPGSGQVAPATRPDSGQPAPARIAGHLVVRSSPSRASVTLNGQWRGRTPLTLDALPFGKYVVRVVQDGFNVAREEVTLTPQDASRTIDARLEAKARGGASLRPSAPEPAVPARPAQPAVTTGSLYVDSRPRGATVVVDGKEMGQTPLTLSEVSAGAHVVRIEMTGKKSWTALARVAAGKLERVTGSLEDQR
jgi:hypothetical protein